ncbi:putative metalloprotease CJM1_0395 family protein [Arenibaculum pallidiluteum]|uniref:putative metalloprotease CJM1_0395 family protein n=1 Tax=Arenibaculum pallidiluteum TaxID=2812559 RepID=UPI001A969EC4|nr:putative metalloprotease CJM1_0395 family protein [Arenibaculum pallidiluteum]
MPAAGGRAADDAAAGGARGFGPAVVMKLSVSASSDGAAGKTELSEDEQKAVRELKARDQEVRAHEQAHASVGGQHAGSPSYSYQAGPDGRRYAVGGEVQIDTSPEADPEATIRKMEVVKRAALAPAEPSSADVKVAASADRIRQDAERELNRQKAVIAEQDGNVGPGTIPGAQSGDVTGVAADPGSVSAGDPTARPDTSRFATASAAYAGAARLLISGPYGAGIGAGVIGRF